ncbi:hypothetical protein ACFOWM_03390 [Ferruginibacter yonginensis]|uniref:Uncharacterized protein n=1 Tax=Ferruginibacter yonginensis TaxID=1310416 RepID=A0ABV8QQ92_9BACT
MELISLVTLKNVITGLGDVIFLAPLDHFTTVKKPEPPFDTPGASVIIADTHEFMEGKHFYQFATAPEKNKLEAKTAGDKGSQYLDVMMEAILPGTYAEQHEFIKNIINKPCIALVYDADCAGHLRYQVGTECNPAYVMADFSTGTTKDGIKGYTCTIMANHSPIRLYAGDIQLAPNVGVIIQTEEGNILTTEEEEPLET